LKEGIAGGVKEADVDGLVRAVDADEGMEFHDWFWFV